MGMPLESARMRCHESPPNSEIPCVYFVVSADKDSVAHLAGSYIQDSSTFHGRWKGMLD